MSMNRPDIEQIQSAMATSLREHWVLFLVEGIILVILGLAAIVVPPIATLAVELLFWLALSHQRNRRPDHNLLDATSAGLLVVTRVGDSWNCSRYRAAIVALEWHRHAYLGAHRIFYDRRCCLDNVRA